MKNFFYLKRAGYAFLLFLLMLSAGCSNDESDEEVGMGTINVSLVDIVQSGASNARIAADDFVPTLNLSDFGLTIYDTDNQIVKQYPIGSIPTGEIELFQGLYTAVVDNENDGDVSQAHYIGTEDFTVIEQQTTNVAILAELQEIIVQFTLPTDFFTIYAIQILDNTDQEVYATSSSDANVFLPELAFVVDPLDPFSGSSSYRVVILRNGVSYREVSLEAGTKGVGYNVIPNFAGDAIISISADPVTVTDVSNFDFSGQVVAIGDFAHGGVVFWIDPNNPTSGLACAIQDQQQAPFGCPTISVSTSSSIGSGAANTAAILTACSDLGIAAEVADNLVLNGFDDWYLPSVDELGEMRANRTTIDATAIANGGSAFIFNDFYWSSTELSASSGAPWLFDNNSSGASSPKGNAFNVRAIRAF